MARSAHASPFTGSEGPTCHVFARDIDRAQQAAPTLQHGVQSWTNSGLSICGHAVADQDDMVPCAFNPVVTDWLRRKQHSLDAVLGQLSDYEPYLGENAKQILNYLYRAALPARVLRLLRVCDTQQIQEFVEEYDIVARRLWCSLLHLPQFSSIQWQILTIPLVHGGLGLRTAVALHVVARISALAQCPKHGPGSAYFKRCFDNEMRELQARYQSDSRYPAAALVRQAYDDKDVSSVKSLQRRLLAHYDLQQAKSVLVELAASRPIIEYHWLKHIAAVRLGSAIDQPGLGSWITSLPTSPLTSLTNEQWLFGIYLRLVVIDFEGHVCQRLVADAKACNKPMDSFGVHAGTCPHALCIRRHNTVCDLLADLGKAGNCTVQKEQRVGSAHWTGEHVAGAQPVHTADLVVVTPQGHTMFLDVRTTCCPHDVNLDHRLQLQETYHVTYWHQIYSIV